MDHITHSLMRIFYVKIRLMKCFIRIPDCSGGRFTRPADSGPTRAAARRRTCRHGRSHVGPLHAGAPHAAQELVHQLQASHAQQYRCVFYSTQMALKPELLGATISLDFCAESFLLLLISAELRKIEQKCKSISCFYHIKKERWTVKEHLEMVKY